MKIKLNKSKKKIIIIITILLFVIGIILFTKRNCIIGKKAEDLIIFPNLLHINTTLKDNTKINSLKDNANNIYEMNILYNNKAIQTIGLSDTINKNTLKEEKISPGTKGGFVIKIYSNDNSKYKIEVHNQNEKPKNIFFKVKGSEKNYKELDEIFNGKDEFINKGEIKEIEIEWIWEFDNGVDNDYQDTKDGNKLKEYKFEIIVKGGEI